MNINLDVDPDSPFAYSINNELARENEALKEKLREINMKKKTRKKIVVKGLKQKQRKIDADYVPVQFGNRVLKIHYSKKPEITKGYFNENAPDVDKIIEKKINDALKNRSKIHLNIKPQRTEKKIILKVPDKKDEKPEPRVYRTVHLHKKPVKIKKIQAEQKKTRHHIKLKIIKHESLNQNTERKINKTRPLAVKTGRYTIPLIIKPPEEKKTIKTGYIENGSGGLSVIVPLLKELIGQKQGENAPVVKGMKIPEV